MVLRSYAGEGRLECDRRRIWSIEGEKPVWLNWGSFWGGIKMRRIDPATGKPSGEDEQYVFLVQPAERTAHRRV